jgi:hypothetical protein
VTRKIAAVVALCLAGCASSQPNATKAQIPEPEIQITQLSNVAEAARHITGGLSVQYRVDVANRANVPIVVTRMDIVSLGEGAYSLRPTSVPFTERLDPGETKTLQFWAPASIGNPTILGANGPVTVRLTAHYDTPQGAAQSIVVQQVQGAP